VVGKARTVHAAAQLEDSSLRVGQARDDRSDELQLGFASFPRLPQVLRNLLEVTRGAKGGLVLGFDDCGELPVIVVAKERRYGRIACSIPLECDKS